MSTYICKRVCDIQIYVCVHDSDSYSYCDKLLTGMTRTQTKHMYVIHVCMHVYMTLHVCECVSMCTDSFMYKCMYVCIYVCVYVY